jgi:hypothetical protein
MQKAAIIVVSIESSCYQGENLQELNFSASNLSSLIYLGNNIFDSTESQIRSSG